MIEDGEILSGEEIRELLREDLAERDDPLGKPSAPTSDLKAASRRVLLVSRGGSDVELLRSRLEANGVQVSSVRNPFTALDHLRSVPEDAVVTDLDLWANGGALLFERIRALEKEVPVLALGKRREDVKALEERALRAGAWRVLFHPLEAGQVEQAVQDLLALGSIPAPNSHSSGLGRISFPAPGSAAYLSALEDKGLESSGLREGKGRETRSLASEEEVRWLRFFHQFSRAFRSWPERDALLKELLRIASKELDAQAAGVFYRDGGRPLAIIEGKAAMGALEFQRLVSLMGSTAGSSTSLTFSFGDPAEGSYLVLLGLSLSCLGAGRPFFPDIQDLLERLRGGVSRQRASLD